MVANIFPTDPGGGGGGGGGQKGQTISFYAPKGTGGGGGGGGSKRSNYIFLCPQRNLGRHIVIALSVSPASCPVHISYIL